MEVAFVLINAEVGAEREVFGVLKAIPGIKEAHMVYGVYDILARVEAGLAEGLKDVLALKIWCIDKVRSTLTMIVTGYSE